MNFDQAFERLLGHEGGYTDNPNDRGNWTSGIVGRGELKGTKFGISAMAYPQEDIKNLTVGRAKEIYFRDYWTPAGCEAVPAAVKFDLFDAAVNSGIKNAVRFLQRACGATVDGVLGPRTMAAVAAMDPARVAARFNGARLDFMNDNPHTWAEFGRGWAQRIADNLLSA